MRTLKPILLTLAALMLAIALPLAGAATKGSWTGWITDDHCGSKGAKAEHKSCAEKCLGHGSKLVFYNSADQKIYSLDNQDLAKEHLGHEVKVTGEVDGSAIKVESIAMAQGGK
jgi:hypothetical protein